MSAGGELVAEIENLYDKARDIPAVVDRDAGGSISEAIWTAYENDFTEFQGLAAQAGVVVQPNNEIYPMIGHGAPVEPWVNANTALREARDGAYENYRGFLESLLSFMDDFDFMQFLDNTADTWATKVFSPEMRDLPLQIRDSKVLEAWTGPGAEKYLTAVVTQSAAVEDMNRLAATLATNLDQANGYVKGVATTFITWGQEFISQLNGLQNDDSHYGIRTFYAESAMSGFATEASSMAGGEFWGSKLDTLSTTFSDLLTYGEVGPSFRDGTWPQAVVDGVPEMSNGNSGLADQTGHDDTHPVDRPEIGDTTTQGETTDPNSTEAEGQQVGA